MKTTRRLWAVVAGIGAALVAGAVLAQVAEVTVVEETPLFGTFYSLQRTNDPPLPFSPFPELTLYAVGTNTYFHDDRDLDYLAMARQAAALRLLRQAAAGDLSAALSQSQLPADGMSLLGLDSDPPAPPGGDEGGGTNLNAFCGPPMFLSSTGLCLYPPVLTGSNGTFSGLSLTLTNGVAGAQYDLFNTTNLAPALTWLNLTNWVWLSRGAPGQTNFTVSNPPVPESYYTLGTMQDSDGDGLTDAYEWLVSHTALGSWSTPDTDQDGMPDGWEVAQGLAPSSGDAGADPDGDGLTHWSEWLAGGDPQAAAGGVWVSSPAVGSVIP